MPTDTLDDKSNIEKEYDRSKGAYNPSELRDVEKNFGDHKQGGGSDNPADNAREVENRAPKPGWNTNVTGGAKGAAGLATASTPLGKGRALLNVARQHGPIGTIIAVIIFLASTFGVLGANSFLGQAITAMLHEKFSGSIGMISAANLNIMQVKYFGSSVGVDCNDAARIMCKLGGISSGEMKAMQRNGVRFIPADGKKNALGLISFDAMEVNGERVTAANFAEKYNNDKYFRKVIRPGHNPIWKSTKNAARKLVRKAFGLSTDADTKAKNKEEFRKKVYDQAGDGSRSGVDSGRASDIDPDDEATNQKANNVATGTDALNDEVGELKEAAQNGDSVGKVPSETTEAFVYDGTSVDQALGRASPLRRAWSFLNDLDFADALCTSYQMANLAVSMARTAAMINAMRFASIFLSAWDKAKSGYIGNSEPEEITELMNALTAVNSLGLTFDRSASAQYLFHGKLTNSTPLSLSSLGTDALRTVSRGLYALHSTIGAGNPIQGRTILRNTCNIVTNFAVQAIVTVGTALLSIITGGAGAVVKELAQQGVSALLDAAKRTIRDQLVTRIRNIIGRGAVTAAEKQAARREARQLVRSNLLDKWNLIAGALILVETFGMDYIAQTMAGTDILGYLEDPVETMDAIVAGRAAEDYTSNITMGGQVVGGAAALTYLKENQKAIDDEIAIERSIANPFDLNNPYSMMGSFMGSIALPLSSISNFSSIPSLLKNVALLPQKAFSGLSKTVGAAEGLDPTPENIAEFVDDEYMIENGIVTDIMGNPIAGADLAYIKSSAPEEILQDAMDDGYITETGEIIAGSEYETHVTECNNPLRAQVDATIFDDVNLMPKHCYDGSDQEQRSYMNLVTTLRALLLDKFSVVAAQPGGANQGAVGAGGTIAVSGGWAPPINRAQVTRNYNNYGVARAGYAHNGVDYAAPLGTPIYAAHGGVVSTEYRRASSSTPATFYIVITNPSTGVVTEYGHSYENQILVTPGQTVTAGTQITTVGNQGNSTGPHLHFGTVIGGTRQNPTTVLAQQGITI